MENLFVWMLIFAGATIGLLGTFLIASERELKAKRREVEELTSKLGDNDADNAVNQPADTPQPESQATAELRARNQDLLAEVASLSNRLEASQRTIDELRLAEPRQEAYGTEKQQRLETEIENLQRQLASEQEKVRELESACGRLEEMERLDQDLRGENRRLQEENARWEKQVAAGNESQRRLGLLRQYVGELQAKQASVIENQVQLQDDLSALVRLLEPRATSFALRPSSAASAPVICRPAARRLEKAFLFNGNLIRVDEALQLHRHAPSFPS